MGTAQAQSLVVLAHIRIDQQYLFSFFYQLQRTHAHATSAKCQRFKPLLRIKYLRLLIFGTINISMIFCYGQVKSKMKKMTFKL